MTAAFLAILGPASAQEDVDVDELRTQFESVVQGLNDNSYDRFHRALVIKDMTARIYGGRLIEPDVKKSFASDFPSAVEQMFSSSFPKSKTDILGTLIDFQFQGSEGRAVVRYSVSGYRYSYHVYELRLDSKGRMAIVDWIDYYQGSRFSDMAGEALVMAMPSKAATRNMLENKNLDEGDVFQVGELFKAVRDNKPERFFQIYDGLNDTILNETAIMRANLHLALIVRDGVRIESAVRALVEKYPNDPLYSLRLIEYYIPERHYDKAIDALVSLQEGIGVKDGATESLKASAALAMGNTADAEKFALQATAAEPALELVWWSLLRARTRAKDYSGATEALARLEDDFGHTLDPETLRRDRFLKVLADKQEYLDWRAARN
ncbi:MAG: tetratricopeptide repeat protein [Woeseiaceae bacterium]